MRTDLLAVAVGLLAVTASPTNTFTATASAPFDPQRDRLHSSS